MLTLLLYRHAKSDWGDVSLNDFDRALAPRGIRASEFMAHYILDNDLLPDRILCSTARRARHTLLPLIAMLREPLDVEFRRDLYNHSEDDYLSIVRGAAPARRLMILAHNPATELTAAAPVRRRRSGFARGHGDEVSHGRTCRNRFRRGALGRRRIGQRTARPFRQAARFDGRSLPLTVRAVDIGRTKGRQTGTMGVSKLTTLTDDALITLGNMTDFATGLVVPTIRLGVTGLARSGKTVFITAFVHALMDGGRLPAFRAYADGRLVASRLSEQPDPTIPRFDYEEHLRKIIDERHWPESTRQISELRLEIQFESRHFLSRQLGTNRLTVDIVDYPGEWLLDLPLLAKSFDDWSAETLARARSGGHRRQAAGWLSLVDDIDPAAEFDEPTARRLHEAFTDYLRLSRQAEHALSALPPGRFLMPGDLEGSPALTFCPLPKPPGALKRTSLGAVLADRYEAYKGRVVRPFFRDHFVRLDRQIVLVDALHAVNAGAEAVRDLETALTDILGCFRPGSGSWLSSLLTRRIDRILFAATKADHLHDEDHDDLERLLETLVSRAFKRARFAGAKTETLAIAAVRATRQGRVKSAGESYPAILGEPMAGETLDGEAIGGQGELAIFPGDLPSDPKALFDPDRPAGSLNFVRFRPPRTEAIDGGAVNALPHIRLDRALEFLLGDKLS